MKIYLDFDGTIVEHDYPKIGEYNLGCFEIIKKLQNAGHVILLNTFRVEFNNNTFEQALAYMNSPLINLIKPIPDFTPYKIYPPEWDWKRMLETNEMFIDDASVNIPLRPTIKNSGFMVDWYELDKQFKENNMYQS